MVVGDIAAIALAFLVAYQIRATMEPRPNRVTPISDYFPTLALQIAALVVSFALLHLYLPQRGRSHSDQLGAIVRGIMFGNFGAMVLTKYVQRGPDVPIDMVLYAFALSIGFVWVSRTLIEQCMRLARQAGFDPELVLIIGTGDAGRTILRKIEARDASYKN